MCKGPVVGRSMQEAEMASAQRGWVGGETRQRRGSGPVKGAELCPPSTEREAVECFTLEVA